MQCRLPPRVVCAFVLAAFAAVIEAPSLAAAQQPFAEHDIRKLVKGLRDGTLPPAFVSDECRRGLTDEPDAEGTRQVMSTYLEVPEELAIAAFCSALVQAIKTGEVTEETLVAVGREEMNAGTFLEVGRILRAVFFSHRLTTTASAEEQSLQ